MLTEISNDLIHHFLHKCDVDEYLKSLDIEKVIICGLLTSVCVLFTAQTSFALGFEVYLCSNCCADRNINNHNNIISMYNNYIFKVI